ncbi:hypothetical protein B9Z55_022057 [Caenorhabditis nigoni]|uniref:Uncharacterized protein n=1 Tax=Caenorhabditis nigoni TaxID=1611254 RepID=A0A2G5TUR8_9PELO|nr:hypothetical protein B9Z55_022057 [Caenorhabditis nigoni]
MIKLQALIFGFCFNSEAKILIEEDDRYVNGGVRFDNDAIEEGSASGATTGLQTPRKIAGFRRRQSGYGIAISR